MADLAAVVIDNRTGEVVAYVGNASAYRDRPGVQVDIAASPRSTGSILKPFLYEAALQEGIILPHTLLPDIPVNLGGFAPQNFDRQFYGAVPANEALARSLNVPAVFLLRQYGVPKFHSLLQKAGLTTLTQTPEHYGLSLILGGGEGRLDEITAAYSQMAASACAPEAPRAHGGSSQLGRCAPEALYAHGKLAVWYTLDALKEVNRPDELDWRLIRSVRKAAWKTGTSYGFRDAWAVGMTPEYTIGVWAGNADGHGVPKFHSLLQKAGLTTLTQTPDHYGLSLILGGGEGRLDEITAAYSQMAASACAPEAPRAHEGPSQLGRCAPGALYAHGKQAVWYTLDALKEVNRPDELDWRLIRSVRKAAWKTGTSYGFRDAWAVGMTPEYTIGVWAGNADGHGVPGLTGARTAGPVMFAILGILPKSDRWFEEPEEGVSAKICTLSGMLATPDCPAEEMIIPKEGLQSDPCPYHKTGEFVLTPAMEWFYKPHHPEYIGAKSTKQTQALEFIYPSSGSTLYLPRQLSGEIEGVVFRVAHHQTDATVFWHLDQTYVGETRFIHELRLAPDKGKHTLTVVDGEGNVTSIRFTVAE